jgi:hypothetical protein
MYLKGEKPLNVPPSKSPGKKAAKVDSPAKMKKKSKKVD